MYTIRDIEYNGGGFVRDRRIGLYKYTGTLYYTEERAVEIQVKIYPDGGTEIIGPATDKDKQDYLDFKNYISSIVDEGWIYKRRILRITSTAGVLLGIAITIGGLIDTRTTITQIITMTELGIAIALMVIKRYVWKNT